VYVFKQQRKVEPLIYAFASLQREVAAASTFEDAEWHVSEYVIIDKEDEISR